MPVLGVVLRTAVAREGGTMFRVMRPGLTNLLRHLPADFRSLRQLQLFHQPVTLQEADGQKGG